MFGMKATYRCHICGEKHKEDVTLCRACEANMQTQEETRLITAGGTIKTPDKKLEGVFILTDRRLMFLDSNYQMNMSTMATLGTPTVYSDKGNAQPNINIPLGQIHTVQEANGLLKKGFTLNLKDGGSYDIFPEKPKAWRTLFEEGLGLTIRI